MNKQDSSSEAMEKSGFQNKGRYRLISDDEPKVQSSGSKLTRLPIQAAKETVATVGGIPGNIFELINDYISGPLTSKITGKETVPYEELPISQVFPTHAQNIQNIEGMFPSTKPKNELERFVGELASDTASLLAPVKTKIPFQKSAFRAFSTALGANVLGSLAKDVTGDEKKKAYTKMGSLFLLSLLHKPSAAKEVGKLYKQAESVLPEGAKVSGKNLQSSMDRLKDRILKGRSYEDLAPSEKFVVDESEKVLRNIKDGEIGVATLTAAKRSLNEQLDKIMRELPNKSGRQRARKLATEINHSLRDTMKEYKSQNPEWYKLQTGADEAFKTISESNYLTQMINKHLKYNPMTSGLLHVLGGATGSLSGLVAPYQGMKILHRMKKSPVLRKHYTNVMKAAAAEDATIMNKELERLDKELQKDKKKSKDRFRLVD